MKKIKKKCELCKLFIDEEIDEWYENTLMKQGKIDSEIYFHRDCYKDFHKVKFHQAYMEKMKKLTPLLEKFLPEKEIEVRI